MNKWVVVILMLLAFAAGGLSMYKMGQRSATSAATPGAVAETPAGASPSPVAESSAVPLARPTEVTSRAPHFGRPPKPGAAGSTVAAAKPIKGEIKAVIFSLKDGGEALTRFPKNTKDIYMTLTPNGIGDDVELVASMRSAMNEGEAFTEPVQSSGPPRRRTFRFAPPSGGWVSGPYQVVVKPAGSEQVLTLSRFEIDKADAAKSVTYENPQYLMLKTDPAAQEGSSVFNENDRQILLQVDSLKVPGTVKVRSVWSAVEVEQLTPGELVAVSETLPPGGDQDALFSFTPLKPNGNFYPGSYRVDVYFDQQQVGSQAFFIQPAEDVAADLSGTPDLATDTATP